VKLSVWTDPLLQDDDDDDNNGIVLICGHVFPHSNVCILLK